MGFAFLALVIGLPPGPQPDFARREVSIRCWMPAPAPLPPLPKCSAGHGHERGWRRSGNSSMNGSDGRRNSRGHLSYPVLAYFRSQHDNESWLGALTAILDNLRTGHGRSGEACERQAELTFAMARHAVVDLCLVFRTRPRSRYITACRRKRWPSCGPPWRPRASSSMKERLPT